MAYFYVLHSKTLNRYYVGHSEHSPEERLKKHLTNHNGYTAKAKDWIIAYSEAYETKEEAYARERQVKGWKSKKKIAELISKLM